MILFQTDTTALLTAPPAALVDAGGFETDPVKILGRRMRELAAQGRTVDKAELLVSTEFTSAEIDRYGPDAVDHAKRLARGEV